MVVKTKLITGYYEYRGEEERKYVDLDDALNRFLENENITYDRLIDIKYAPLGLFESNTYGGDGELEPSALIIYKKEE